MKYKNANYISNYWDEEEVLARNDWSGALTKLMQKSASFSSVLISILRFGHSSGAVTEGFVQTQILPLWVDKPRTGLSFIFLMDLSTNRIFDRVGVKLSFIWRSLSFKSRAFFMMANFVSRWQNFTIIPLLSGVVEPGAGGLPMRCAVLMIGSVGILRAFFIKSVAMDTQFSFGAAASTLLPEKIKLSLLPYASNSSCLSLALET